MLDPPVGAGEDARMNEDPEDGVGFTVEVDVRVTDPVAAAAYNMSIGQDEHGASGMDGPQDDVGRVREALARVVGDALQGANTKGDAGFLTIRYSVTQREAPGGDRIGGEFRLP